MTEMTIKEMLIYVEVAIENLEYAKKDITKNELLRELSFLSYHQNKRSVLNRKNYEEKFF